MDLPQDPATPILGIHSKDSVYYDRNTYSSMFIDALSITAAIVSVDSYVHQPYYVWRTLLPWNYPSPLALAIFLIAP